MFRPTIRLLAEASSGGLQPPTKLSPAARAFFEATEVRLQGPPAPPAGIHPSRQRSKIATGIKGIDVHPAPLDALKETYSNTLKLLKESSMPPTAAYRLSVEAITEHRRGVVERALDKLKELEKSGGENGKAAATGNATAETIIEGVEKELDSGLVEEVIMQATDELSLTGKMIEWKTWEELEEKPLPGQWEYFPVPPSTTGR